jgi:hypothetical protein
MSSNNYWGLISSFQLESVTLAPIEQTIQFLFYKLLSSLKLELSMKTPRIQVSNILKASTKTFTLCSPI